MGDGWSIMFWCAIDDDLSLRKTVLVNQIEEFCGITGGQSNATMRRGLAKPRRNVGAVKSYPAREEHGIRHRRPIVLTRIPDPACPLTLEDARRCGVALYTGGNRPDVHDGVVLPYANLLRREVGLQHQS